MNTWWKRLHEGRAFADPRDQPLRAQQPREHWDPCLGSSQTVLNAVANTDLVLASRMEVPASSECSTTPMQCERVNIDAETNG